jgi:hypothetical protein
MAITLQRMAMRGIATYSILGHPNETIGVLYGARSNKIRTNANIRAATVISGATSQTENNVTAPREAYDTASENLGRVVGELVGDFHSHITAHGEGPLIAYSYEGNVNDLKDMLLNPDYIFPIVGVRRRSGYEDIPLQIVNGMEIHGTVGDFDFSLAAYILNDQLFVDTQRKHKGKGFIKDLKEKERKEMFVRAPIACRSLENLWK